MIIYQYSQQMSQGRHPLARPRARGPLSEAWAGAALPEPCGLRRKRVGSPRNTRAALEEGSGSWAAKNMGAHPGDSVHEDYLEQGET